MKTKSSLCMPFRLSNLILFLFLIFSLQVKAGADSYFSPTNRDQLNVTLPAGADGYNYVDFRIFSHTSTPYSDRMNYVTMSYQDGQAPVVQFMAYGMADFDHPVNNNFFSSTNFGNSVSTGVVSYLGSVNGSNTDLRYLNFRWYYPQNLAGKTVKFQCNWKWELDWWCCSKWSSGIDNSLSVNLPPYNPAQITNPVLKTIDGSADGKWFNIAWDKYDASLGSTTLELYSDNTYTNKKYTSAAATGTGAAGSVNLALGALNNVNTVYPRLVFTIGTGNGYKVYTKNMNPVNVAGFPNPVLGTCSFDPCTKATSLNWTYSNPSQVDANSKVYIYRKVNDGANSIYTLLTPSGLGMNVVSYIDNDPALAWDKKYTYIIRTIPNILNATSVNFTKTDAHTYLPELLVKTDISTSRLTIDFSSFTAVGNIAVVSPAKAANAEISWKMTWCTNNPANITIRRINLINSLDVKDFVVAGNSLKYVDYTAVNAVPYRYQLQLDNNGRMDTSEWKDVKIVDKAKFVSLTTTKGVLNDRIRLSWEIDKPLLNDKFVIYRKIYDNGSKVFNYEMVAEKQSSNKIENWEDLSVSPGILYQYQIKSYYQPATGDAVEVLTADSVGLGFSQPIGTISGNIVFGAGTAVGGVNVSVENQDMEQKLYKSIEFNKQGTQFGGVAKLKAAKHGCIANGFTWQAWLKPANRTQVNAYIYEMRNEYSIRLDGNAIKVYVNDNSITTPLITTNIGGISGDKFFHFSLSYNKTSQYLKTSLNGVAADSVKLTTAYTCKNTTTAEAKLASPYLSTNANFVGNIDEMRLWNRALTNAEIKANYDRYLAGTELDLIGYWQMDEGINSFIFDKSNISKSYNENHISLVGAVTSDAVPTLEQLSIKTTTDNNGNYIIQGVPYKGNGSTYQVVPSLGTHEFEPAKQLIFIGGTSSEVQSKISFKDISSFKISGDIFYENTTYPVEGVEFLVDGNTCTRDNVVLVSDANGHYEIDVPIGEHKITLRKNGHVFADANADATLKLGLKYNFNVNKSNINFVDQTKVTLVGRVTGGNVQETKPIGFNRSKANIGTAVVKLQPKLKQKYTLNTLPDSLIYISNDKDIKSIAKVKNGDDIIRIVTDPANGEFSVQVPPIPMVVTSVSAGSLASSDFKYGNLPPIDMNPLISSIDTIHNGTKVVDGVTVTAIDSCKYNQRLNITYISPKAEFIIRDKNYSWKAFGDSLYNYVDPNNPANNKTLSMVTRNTNGNAVYKTSYPVFTQGNYYTFDIVAYEKYINPSTKDSDLVYLKNATINIENKLSTKSEKTAYTLDSLGRYTYRFMVANPNIVSPYTKGMTASIEHNDVTEPWTGTLNAIVTGAVPVGGVDFVTKGPDQVIAVLRDPPGSNSYATLEKGSSVSSTKSYTGIGKESSGHKFIANLGGEQSIGIGLIIETKNKLDIGGGIEQSVEGSDGTSRTESYSFTESISTSSSTDYIGANGDLYIANSSNIGF
ncbi:MAG: LamG-like jellyroll fold domain-containing protein, partial [Paludibacter sp.]|nr:LamG-like jellyroll fold domain-containing protein [Paludibacter sp.]